MKLKEVEKVHCVTFGLYPSVAQTKMFTQIFNIMTDCKNDYIRYVWKALNNYGEKDSTFKTSLDLIKNQKKLYGTAVNKQELNEDIQEAYLYVHKIFKEKTLSLLEMLKEFKKCSSKRYKIYLADDMVHYGLTAVNTGFEQMLFKRSGQNVFPKRYKDLSSIQSKPMYPIKKDGTIGTEKNSCSLSIEIIDNIPYLVCKDYTNQGLQHIFAVYDSEKDIFSTKTQACPHHKNIKIRIRYNKKDLLQKQIIENKYMGCLKISRIYKKGTWRYFVQINFEETSPNLQNLNFDNRKVAVNVNTEMVAIVRDDGSQELIELTPTTPRTTEQLDNVKRYLDNSKRSTNKELFKEDGQIKYTKSKMKELGLNWNYSNGYNKARKVETELYRLNTDERKRNNYKLARKIIQSGNEFIMDNNQFKAWQMKLNRMSKKSKDKYDNGIRKANDYAKQIHDRAPGFFTARIESICDQLQLPFTKLSTFNSSNYNHFTQEEDLFINLNERFATLDKDVVKYNEYAIDFFNTFGVYEFNGKKYVLQRDLYAASKMLFINQKTETKLIEKNGNSYKSKRTIDEFDQKAYSKWFDDVFYPKHLDYIKELVGQYNLNIDINGLILGNK